MTFIADILKGIFIGIANIIPGVSGGTMAVSFGIYDKLISAVSNFIKNWKKSFLTLLPIGIGCVIGLIGFTYAVEFLLLNHTFVTCMTFIGLILGGIPVIVQSLRKKSKESGDRIGIIGIITFISFFTISIILPLLNSNNGMLKTFTATPTTMLSFFLVGILAAATMVVPGVSGSMVLMILGYYYGILKSIKSFLQALSVFDFTIMMQEFWLLMPLGIGIILGIFLIAKAITYLFEHHSVPTYCAILGLIASSPFAIAYNTGILDQLSAITISHVFLGLLLAIIGAVLTYKIGAEE